MGDDPSIPNNRPIVAAVALDVSRQGMRLRSKYNVSVGSHLSAIAYYKDRDSVCLCEVVWKREDAGQLLYGLFIKEWSKLDPVLNKKLTEMEKEEQEQLQTPANPGTPTAFAVTTPSQLIH